LLLPDLAQDLLRDLLDKLLFPAAVHRSYPPFFVILCVFAVS
jgi:hypothetical protein